MNETYGKPHSLRSGYFVEETADCTLDFGMGGLRGRFKDGKQKRIGRYDPFGGKPVVFRTEATYHNWVLRRLDPDVIDVDESQEPWSALYRGKNVTVQPSLFIRWRDRPASLDFVIEPNKRASTRLTEGIQLVGRAHGVDTSIRTSVDIHADPKLLEHFEWLLQRVAMYSTSQQLSGTQAHLNRLLSGTRQWTRAQVIAAVRHGSPHVDVGLIDTALMLLRNAGKVRIDLVSSEYSDGSAIESNF